MFVGLLEFQSVCVARGGAGEGAVEYPSSYTLRTTPQGRLDCPVPGLTTGVNTPSRHRSGTVLNADSESVAEGRGE